MLTIVVTNLQFQLEHRLIHHLGVEAPTRHRTAFGNMSGRSPRRLRRWSRNAVTLNQERANLLSELGRAGTPVSVEHGACRRAIRFCQVLRGSTRLCRVRSTRAENARGLQNEPSRTLQNVAEPSRTQGKRDEPRLTCALIQISPTGVPCFRHHRTTSKKHRISCRRCSRLRTHHPLRPSSSAPAAGAWPFT